MEFSDENMVCQGCEQSICTCASTIKEYRLNKIEIDKSNPNELTQTLNIQSKPTS